ncbi:unnamed protein product [Protopolystoma xenopodis]|uniref:Uncharacterized protein n=1 Tax=Protopolystoma xenopodis TaxID=117903 RepID=A0A3S5CPB1_9PLAT|nr:unnamed protein product [Protopolystoma xenopodis]
MVADRLKRVISTGRWDGAFHSLSLCLCVRMSNRQTVGLRMRLRLRLGLRMGPGDWQSGDQLAATIAADGSAILPVFALFATSPTSCTSLTRDCVCVCVLCEETTLAGVGSSDVLQRLSSCGGADWLDGRGESKRAKQIGPTDDPDTFPIYSL